MAIKKDKNCLFTTHIILFFLLFPVTGIQADFKVTVYTNSNLIGDISISGDNIWCSTGGGIVRWDKYDGTYECFTYDDGVSYLNTGPLYVAANNLVWMSDYHYHTALFRYDREKLVEVAKDLPGFTVMATDSKGTIWQGTYYGLLRYDENNPRLYTTEDGLLDDNIRCMIIGKNDVIWMGTDKGVSRFHGSSWVNNTMEDGLPGKEVISIAEDMDGIMWCVTKKNGGIASFDGTDWKHHTAEEGFPSGHLNLVVVDRDNRKWFGTTSHGLYMFDGTEVTSYSTENSLIPDNQINDIAIDSDGVVWLSCGHFTAGFAGLGLTRFDGAAWRSYKTDGPAFDVVTDTRIDSNDVKHFLTWAGTSSFDGISWTNNTEEGFTTDWYYEIDHETDHDGVKWFIIQAQARSFDGKEWTSYSTEDGLADNNVRDIAVDTNNVKWFGTDHGVSSYDGSTWTTYDSEDNIGDNPVGSVSVDSNNVKWFAIRHKGLWRYDGSTWESFTTENSSLFSSDINDIAADMNNKIWISFYMGRGVQSFDGTEWNTYYGETEIPGAGQVYSISVDSNNVKWFGTFANGVVSLDDNTPSEVTDHPETMNLNTVTSYPNPFNNTTLLQYYLETGGKVSLDIYTITGQKVTTLVSGYREAGSYSVFWDGTDDENVRVSSGLYLYRLNIDNKIMFTGKGLLIK